MVHVVVDSQMAYVPFGPVLEAIEREIVAAKEKDEPIVLLEYYYGGATYPHILALLEGYRHYERKTKRTFGGANEVIRACTERGWEMTKFRITGAETYCCVAETSEGLLLACPDSEQEVVRAACFDKVCGGDFPRHENIRWV
jgi:hypothetical protein